MPKAAIIIGLGGVGKVILMKIRKLIVEEYGGLSAFPHVQFLHVDTFRDCSLETGQNFKDKVLGVNLLFDAGTERVELSTGLTGKDLARDRRIQEWYPDDLTITCEFEKGAGGVRPFGKIAFHYNANQFAAALKRAAGLACSRGTGGVDAYIVCSLFGGTGSGTFLDVSYSVRKVLQGMGFKPDIIGCFVIGALASDPNMQSSCYAALQELEYFMTMGIHTTLRKQHEREKPGSLHVDAADYRPFEAHYPIAGEGLISFDLPPVNVCYLFGATNAKEQILERDPLEKMIAKRIFFELMPGIGLPLQAKRVDIMNQPSYFMPDRLQERAKTFFSTSTATIEFPAPQIQNALASGLAA